MSNGSPLTVAALLAGLVALGLGIVNFSGSTPGGDGEDLDAAAAEAAEQDGKRLTEVELQGRELRLQVERLRGDLRDRDERLAMLERRISDLAATGSAAATTDAAQPAASGEDAAADTAEFADLQAKVFGGKATADEIARFWELARTSGALNDMVEKLEGKVKASPDDLAARMQLAQGYVAKLLTVPDGPERGAWAMKAEGQWAKVLETDENHWDARYSLGVSWSQWPDFFNKTPDALKQFETLRDVQERGHAEPRHAQTYLSLSRLHRKLGNADKAREALEAGAGRHPEDEDLRKALDALGD